MEKNKILLWIVVCVLLSSFVYSADLDTATYWFSFDDVDNDGDDPQNVANGSIYNGTNQGADTGAVGILGEAFSFVRANTDYVETKLGGTRDSYCITTWVKNTSSCAVPGGHIYGVISATSKYLYFDISTSGFIRGLDVRSGAAQGDIQLCDSEWHHVVWSYNRTGNNVLYVDNVIDATDAGVDSAQDFSIAGFIGALNEVGSPSANTYWSGLIDEFGFYTEPCDSDMVNSLYNGGAAVNPFAVAGAPTADDWNVTSGNNFEENTSIWRSDLNLSINISSDLLSYTFTCSSATCNHSAYVDSETGYSDTDADHKAATTETTSQANTVFDNIEVGNHYLFVSVADVNGETNYTLNFTRYSYPNVSLNTPTDNSRDSDGIINFSYTPSNWGSLINCSLYGNWSGSWLINQSNSTTLVNNSVNYFSEVTLDTGDYLWNVNCFGEKGLDNWSNSNYTFTVQIDNTPNVTLNKPDDNTSLLYYQYRYTGIVFNFSVTEDNEIVNCSLYGNWSGSWELNQTNTSSVINNTNFNYAPINLSIGTYLWNVVCFDNGSQSDSGINRTLFINNSAPQYVSYSAEDTTRDFCQESTQVNATFIDLDGDTLTVYFEDNHSTSKINYSTINLGSNISSVELNATAYSAKYFNYTFIACDSYVCNNSMTSASLDVTKNTTTVTLYLNGNTSNRKYELSYGSNLTAEVNTCTDETVWLDIGDPNYGVNYTNDNDSSVYYNYDIDDITEFRFSDSNTTNNLTFTGVENKTFEIPIPAKAAISSAYITINATGSPQNIKIDSTNNSFYDVIIPGTFIGNTSNQSTFTNNLQIENITFIVPGTQIRYINFSANGEGLVIGWVLNNITMNLSGFPIDENGTIFYDYYDNESYGYEKNTCQGPLWIWDDFSQGDVSNRWDGTYTVNTDNYIYNTETTTTCTPGGSCSDTCQTSTTSNFYSETLALEDRVKTEIRIQLVTAFSRNSGGSCISQPSCGSSSRAGIRDKTSDTEQYFMGGTCSSSGPCSWDSIVEVKRENGYLRWYEDGIYVNELSYDSTHQYEIVIETTSDYEKQGGDDLEAGCLGSGYIHYINSSGVIGNGSMNNYGNCTITYPLIHNPVENISKAIFDVDSYEIGSEGSYSLYLSNDNGTTWESATDNVIHVFTSKGNNLSAMIHLNTTDTGDSVVINKSRISVIPGYITGLTIDIGYNGDSEYNYSSTLNSTNSPQKVNLGIGDAKEYIQDNCLGHLTCAIPIAFISTTSGTLEYSILNITQQFSKIYLNNSRIDDYLSNKTGNQNVTFRVHSDSAGITQLSGINIGYKGGANYSIMAHMEANENYTYSSDTSYLAWRYSPLTSNYPSGVDYYNVYPGGLSSKSVSPYGQYIRTNESDSVGIWNITNTAKDDNVKLYRWFNPSVDSCLVLNTCQYFNQTSCSVVNSTTNQTTVKENMVNNTEYKLYDFWNLTSCDPEELFLPGNFTFRSICQDCVKTWS